MVRYTRLLLLAILCLGFTGGGLLAQTPPPDATVLGARLHHGFILIHSRDLVPVRHSNPTGLVLDVARHKVSEGAWEACHCYPRVGAMLSLWDFDQPNILGRSASGMMYVEPLFAPWRPVSFSIRAAFGLSYQNRPYNPVSNPLNQSYSTRVAFPLQLGGSVHVRVAPRWHLELAATYNHISNGGIRNPNKGINWPTAALGVSHYPVAPAFLNREKRDWRTGGAARHRWEVSLYTAFKEPVSRTFLFSPGVEVKFARQVNRLSALTVGADWIYDQSSRWRMEQAGVGRISPQQGCLALGHEFILGRFLFSQQVGVYAYRPYREGDDVYQRYGLVYRFTERMSAGINLRVHRQVSDMVDVRVGFGF